jgi:hypothetical protein
VLVTLCSPQRNKNLEKQEMFDVMN